MGAFVDWIQAELKQRGWSQATLAERSGLSLSSVKSVLVSGRRQPGMKFFTGLSTAFMMPLADVIVIWEGGERESQDDKG